jgi:GT2 family glycosyltransferase
MIKKIFVVIPNWNGADLIADCLSSLQTQTISFTAVVVDNGSVDDSIKIIERDFSKAHLIKLPYNTGFTGGVNTGIRYALKQGADAIALFNNDAVAKKDWLANLAKRMNHDDKIGITTCKFMRMDKKHFDSTGDCFSIWGMPFPRGRNHEDTGQYDKAERVFSATGGASLYRAEMLKEIGLFDDSFFAYFEDVDISFRANLAGWQVFYEPKAIAYHHVNATSSKLGTFSRYHSIKNFIYTYQKNMPLPLAIRYKPRFLLVLSRMAGGALQDGHIGVFIKAVAVATWHTPSTLKKRREIQRSSKLSSKEINVLLYKKRPPRIPKLDV